MIRACLVAVCVLGLSLVVGCQEQQPPAPKVAVNTHCPIMGGEVTEDGGRSEWQGDTVGFCCPGCIEKWEALSDAEKEAKLASAGEAADEPNS